MGGSGGGSFVHPPAPPTGWEIDGAADLYATFASDFASNLITITDGMGGTAETGYRPAGTYDAIWTRDHSYAVWHDPSLISSTLLRQFIAHRLATRSTNPPYHADFVADRIEADGDVIYQNGSPQYPFMDGIAFVVLACWTDWKATGETTAFDDNQAVIDACMAATPRSVNGCVYSDPANPSCYYGFTDAINITGDLAMGTAMQAWAYKMLDEISGGGSSTVESDTYANLRAHAESGLATLRNGTTKLYKASSVNSASVDYVWATALAVAEELVTGTDRTDSAQALADAYEAGEITQDGWVRHLPIGQYWPGGGGVTDDTYQDGGFWLTPLWDCVRAVDLVDPVLARTWAAEALTATSGQGAGGPWEWKNGGSHGAFAYTASAALVHRFV